jgi:hypothetical protein
MYTTIRHELCQARKKEGMARAFSLNSRTRAFSLLLLLLFNRLPPDITGGQGLKKHF